MVAVGVMGVKRIFYIPHGHLRRLVGTTVVEHDGGTLMTRLSDSGGGGSGGSGNGSGASLMGIVILVGVGELTDKGDWCAITGKKP